MLFADDTVKLQIWSQILESQRFRFLRFKIEYMECKISKWRIRDYSDVTLDEWEIQINNKFMYLDSIIQNDSDVMYQP